MERRSRSRSLRSRALGLQLGRLLPGWSASRHHGPGDRRVGRVLGQPPSVFGAAAAAGKLLGLNEQRMVWALGIAATQSAGLKEIFGTMCKPFHPGSAARNGLKAALLASKDFTSCSERGIEAPEGFAFTYSEALELKFRDQASTALPPDQIEQVMALCWEIESLDDVGDIARASVPA